jgi:pantetheine-phosphate adenylyltransferase
MSVSYIYPGSFSPPTYGHVEIVRLAREVLPHLKIVCSRHPQKQSWFSEKECARLWSSYGLPDQVSVTTFAEATKTLGDVRQVVMIRGLRDETDLEEEKKVLVQNWKTLGLNKFFYLITDPTFCHVSSSAARQAATRLDWFALKELLSPLAVTATLERALGFEHLFLVVGKPGSGKSTFLQELVRMDPRNVHINTDDLNHRLRPMLESHFGTVDLASLALQKEEELKAVIVKPWMSMLADALRVIPKGSRVFVEIPFGMQEDKQMYRFVGGKVVFVGCEEEENVRRLTARHTPHLLLFMHRIPGWKETQEIAQRNHLFLHRIHTDGEEKKTFEAAQHFHQHLNTILTEEHHG